MGRRRNMTNENLLSHKKIIAKKRAFTVFKYFMLVILGVFFVFPFLYLFTSSLMTDEQILNTTSIIPKTINFDAYKILFEHSELLVYVVNTLIVCALNISGVCIMSSLTAFGLCKVKFKGQDLVFTLILATLLLPGTVTVDRAIKKVMSLRPEGDMTDEEIMEFAEKHQGTIKNAAAFSYILRTLTMLATFVLAFTVLKRWFAVFATVIPLLAFRPIIMAGEFFRKRWCK